MGVVGRWVGPDGGGLEGQMYGSAYYSEDRQRREGPACSQMVNKPHILEL